MYTFFKMIYAHFFRLTSQGNIYSMTKLPLANGTNKLLIASLKREVICFEYVDRPDILVPSTKEVLFTYIPNGAEIISIDAFNKSSCCNDFVIGITIIKTDASKETYLNIYSGEECMDFNIDSLAQNCLMIDLNFTPYQLYHSYYPDWSDEVGCSQEIIWLLSGSDSKVHIYRENRQNHTYREVDVEEYFIELSNPPSIVMWMDIAYYDNYKKRVTSFGCESGHVYLSSVDAKENIVINCWNIQFENIISQVRLFLMNTCDSFCDHQINVGKPILNLMVTNTALPSVVYSDVINNGLSKRTILIKSNAYNIASCSCIADYDLDGENEICIGTYGQEMLVYKHQGNTQWKLITQRSFANPIYAIHHFDITGDVLQELVILTLKGVHVLQHDPEKSAEIIKERIREMLARPKSLCDISTI